jgi:hypothetical protein
MKAPLLPVIAIVMSACSGYQYVASPQFVPLNTKKGELQANLYPSGGQIGYAFSDHFSVFATGYKRFGPGGEIGNPANGLNKENSGVVRRGCGASEISAGIGYFKFREPFVFEALFGAGAGKMNYEMSKDLLRNYEFKMTAQRRNLYVQPDFGIKFNKHLELGLFARFNFVQYNNLVTEMTQGDNPEPEKEDQVFLDRKTASLFFVESGASFKAGWTNMKFHVQLSPTVNLYPQHIRNQKINLNLGLSFNVDVIKKQK